MWTSVPTPRPPAPAQVRLNCTILNFETYELLTGPADITQLRWTTAMFEWAERVQRYDHEDWTYEEELRRFHDEGLDDGDAFIDAVSRIFVMGCHAPGCADTAVRRADQRKSTFYLILNEVVQIGRLPTKPPTKMPSQKPTRSPSARPTVLDTPYPTFMPTLDPTPRPTGLPTTLPTLQPSHRPSDQPSFSPTPAPYCLNEPPGIIPIEGCTKYAECNEGEETDRVTCKVRKIGGGRVSYFLQNAHYMLLALSTFNSKEGTLYDMYLGACNWDYLVVVCEAATLAPALEPAPKLLSMPEQTSKPTPEPVSRPSSPQPDYNVAETAHQTKPESFAANPTHQSSQYSSQLMHPYPVQPDYSVVVPPTQTPAQYHPSNIGFQSNTHPTASMQTPLHPDPPDPHFESSHLTPYTSVSTKQESSSVTSKPEGALEDEGVLKDIAPFSFDSGRQNVNFGEPTPSETLINLEGSDAEISRLSWCVDLALLVAIMTHLHFVML